MKHSTSISNLVAAVTRAVAVSSLALSCGLAVSAAQAGELGAAPQITVKYADLDLSRTEGATVLYRRIRAAAAKTCDQFSSREIGVRAKLNSCMDHAVADAVLHVNQPMLLQVYNAQTGKSLAPQLASLAGHH